MRSTRVALLALALLAAVSACGGDGGGESRPNAFVAVRTQDNPIIPSTSTFTELLRLELEPGRYEVTGKVELHNRDGQLPLSVQCGLVPSRTDGAAGQPDDLGSDWGFLHLGRSLEAGQHGGIVLFVSQELEKLGSVVLGCEASGNEHGAFGAYTSIRAIEVASITTENVTP
jgi:hypothetical protein